MTTLTSPKYATPETLTYQTFKKQHDRKRRKSHNPSFIVTYPYVTNLVGNPFDPENWTGASDPDGSIVNIVAANPTEANVVGNATKLTTSALTFTISADIASVTRGDYLYSAVIAKHVSGSPGINFRLRDIAGAVSNQNFVLSNATTSGKNDTRVTGLGNGYYLYDVRHLITKDTTDVNMFLFMDGAISDNAYVQGSFFGLSRYSSPYRLFNEWEDAAEQSEWTETRVTLSTIGGVLNFLATANLPLTTKTVSYTAGANDKAVVKWKRNAGVVGNTFQFRTGDFSSIAFDETNPDPLAVTTGPDGGGYYETTVDLSGHTDYTGAIDRIRLSFGNDSTSDFDIESIKIYSDSELQRELTNWGGVAMPIL